ncbi:MAG TPA: hypothetical protein VFB94_15805 [Acidimicrobiales bacterium]|jgi:hypothetical protein|nr:hypothetical protein [Acidimicrobiales bacterium]
MLDILIPYIQLQWSRLQQAREDDRGITVETMLITGVLAAAAIAALVAIVPAIRGRQNEVVTSLERQP